MPSWEDAAGSLLTSLLGARLVQGPWCSAGPAAPQMTSLRLQNLGLEELPEGIGSLTGLQKLCLGRNLLGLRHDSLPESIIQLTG